MGIGAHSSACQERFKTKEFHCRGDKNTPGREALVSIDHNRSERRRGRQWATDKSLHSFMNSNSVCKQCPVFCPAFISGVLHDRRGKRGGGKADEQAPWSDRTVRNGNRRQAARKARHGAREANKPKLREHSLAGDPSRNGEDTGDLIKDGTRERGRLPAEKRPTVRAAETPFGIRRAFAQRAAISAPALGSGENAQSTVVPPLRERPRKAIRGGAMDPRINARVLAAAEMPSAWRKGGKTMSYLKNLKTEANTTRTLNGALTHGSTGDACLDFFAVAGGMRYRKRCDQIRLFDRAYIETPELAAKLLFHLRDIRGGMGERTLFRTLLRHVAFAWPATAKKNVKYIAEFGRWDDLMCLLDTPAEEEAVRVIRLQLDDDLAALKKRETGDEDAHISLLAKWLPSDKTSSPKTRAKARKLISALDMNAGEYRATLTALRARIGLVERTLTKKQPEKVNYSAVPAQAMLKYRCAFAGKDSDRFRNYLREVKKGTKRIHTETLFPYEVLRPFFTNCGWRVTDPKGIAALEALWNCLPGEIGSQNAISVVDTSGSMYCSSGPLKPALISQAMGLYCAERCPGVFHNHLITFESQPHLVEIKGTTLRDKLRYIGTLPCGGSTNLEGVFDLILRTAVNGHAKQEEMPAVLYIFSDMEFNCAIQDHNRTVYDVCRRKFKAHGYEMPAVVFHNVNSWQMQAPVTAHTKGTALQSGASTHALKEKFDGNITPMEHMLRVLNGARYSMIHA